MATQKRKVRRKPGIDSKLQYSKKLSTAITVIWCIMRLAVMVASVIRPAIADAMVNLVAGVDSVMMINLGFYTGNSVAEKGILAWMEAKGWTLDTGSKKEESDEETDVG